MEKIKTIKIPCNWSLGILDIESTQCDFSANFFSSKYPNEYQILAKIIPILVFPTPGGPYIIVFNIPIFPSPELRASINRTICNDTEFFNLSIPTISSNSYNDFNNNC